MKKFNLFAIGVVAMLMAAVNVSATSNPNGGYTHATCDPDGATTCYAKIDDHYYNTLDLAFTDAKDGDTIDVLANIASGTGLGTLPGSLDLFDATATKGLKTKLTINLDKYTVSLGAVTMHVAKNGNLTVKGTGKLETGAVLATVDDGGTFTTEGGLLLSVTAGDSVIETAGKVVLGKGAEIDGNAVSTQVIKVTDNTADVTLNAEVGVDTTVTKPIVVVDSAAKTGRNETGAKVTFAGGEYVTSASIMNVDNDAVVTVSDGKYTSNTHVFPVTKGSLTVNGGTLESATGAVIRMNGNSTILVDGANVKMTAKSNAAIFTDPAATGSLTIRKGTVTSKTSYALCFKGGKVEYSIEGAEFNSTKDYAAIYIEDALLTGLVDGGEEDNFKGILTGGKYLYLIVGEANVGGKKYSTDDVAKYLIAEGLEQKTEGSYIVLGNGSGDTPTDPTPVDPTPVDPTPSNPSASDPAENPDTLDNVTSVAAMGGISLAIAAAGIATLKKREN